MESVDSVTTKPGRGGLAEPKEEISNNGIYDNAGSSPPDSYRGRNHPWIKFSTQYRKRGTQDIVHSIAHQGKIDFEATNITNHSKGTESPAFEVLAVYEISALATENNKKPRAASNETPATIAKPSYFLRIYSLAIINALQAVVEYYPQVNLNSDIIELRWPYPLLVHHYDELRAFQERCRLTDASALCEREKDAAEHLRLLLEYLDTHIMEKVNGEKKRNNEGSMTFDYQWIAWKPGTTIMTKMAISDKWTIGVVHSCAGGIFEDPPKAWHLEFWNLGYDGEYVSRQKWKLIYPPYDGPKNISDKILIVPGKYDDTSMEEIMEQETSVKEAVEIGKMYWSLLKPACKEYNGATWEDPTKEESGSLLGPQYSYANCYLD